MRLQQSTPDRTFRGQNDFLSSHANWGLVESINYVKPLAIQKTQRCPWTSNLSVTCKYLQLCKYQYFALLANTIILHYLQIPIFLAHLQLRDTCMDPAVQLCKNRGEIFEVLWLFSLFIRFYSRHSSAQTLSDTFSIDFQKFFFRKAFAFFGAVNFSDQSPL